MNFIIHPNSFIYIGPCMIKISSSSHPSPSDDATSTCDLEHDTILWSVAVVANQCVSYTAYKHLFPASDA